jgi:hypothetical protein
LSTVNGVIGAWRYKNSVKSAKATDMEKCKVEERWRSENWLQKSSLIIIGTNILAAAQILGSLIQAGWFKQ